jgi:glycosyltransferase involved in cell wall biosynthesis
LQERKGFDRAIEAWQPLVERFPDWQFHIYGHGPDQGELQRQIDDAGLHDVIKMMGYTSEIERVLAEAELFLLSSRAEGFGMVLVEAMSQGTPAVSFDCPRGPSEIITTGRNGEIVPDGDIPGLTAALARVMGDDELRRRYGEQALVDSREYEMDHIVARWNELIDEVTRTGAVRRAARRVVTRPLRVLRRRRDG